MIRYLNTKLNGITETIDQVDSTDFNSYKEFRDYQKYLVSEYNIAGYYWDLYWSQRGCKQ